MARSSLLALVLVTFTTACRPDAGVSPAPIAAPQPPAAATAALRELRQQVSSLERAVTAVSAPRIRGVTWLTPEDSATATRWRQDLARLRQQVSELERGTVSSVEGTVYDAPGRWIDTSTSASLSFGFSATSVYSLYAYLTTQIIGNSTQGNWSKTNGGPSVRMWTTSQTVALEVPPENRDCYAAALTLSASTAHLATYGVSVPLGSVKVSAEYSDPATSRTSQSCHQYPVSGSGSAGSNPINIGASTTVTASWTSQTGTPVSGCANNWTSYSPSVATVDATTGSVKGVSRGTSLIGTQCIGVWAWVNIEVKDPCYVESRVAALSLGARATPGALGESGTIATNCEPSGGDPGGVLEKGEVEYASPPSWGGTYCAEYIHWWVSFDGGKTWQYTRTECTRYESFSMASAVPRGGTPHDQGPVPEPYRGLGRAFILRSERVA